MVVLTEKDILPPPPPYFAVEHARSTQSLAGESSTASGSRAATRSKIANKLPSHIILLIVYKTLERKKSQYESPEELSSRITRTLYWIANCLRLVNRGFYLSSMHLLRSTYLPFYMSLVKTPYSSDPFPHTSYTSHGKGVSESSSVVKSVQRESQILDLFLLFRLHEDVFTDDTCLHLERSDTLRDLFDFMQPRARLEDLVRDFGVSAGLIYVSRPPVEEGTSSADPSSQSPYNQAAHSPSASMSRFLTCASTVTLPPPFTSTTSLALPAASTSSQLPPPQRYTLTSMQSITPHPRALQFASLSVSFSPRSVGLVLLSQGRKRTVVEISRERSEPLERCASRLIIALNGWVERGVQ